MPRLLAMAVDVGAALTQRLTLSDMLQDCAGSLVRHLEVAFVRVWVFDEPSQTLNLKTSAGQYTHLDGAHSRIVIGEDKIGRIAATRKPILTNSFVDHQDESDDEWALQEGMVAFAGYPLLVRGKLVGVLALFSRTSLDDDTLLALEAVADNIALGVEQTQTDEALAEAENLFGQFAENSRDTFWIVKADFSKHLYIGPSFEEVWGRSRDEMYANPSIFLEWIAEEDRERVAISMEKNSKAGLADEQEFWIVRPDGTRRCLWVKVYPVFDAQGNVSKLCGISHDVTERRHAEKRVSEFYSTVSHELRTPLTSIRAALGLIEGGLTGSISDETLELIQIARGESDRLIRLINDILDIRKIEAGKLQFELQPLLPTEVVSSTLATLRSVAQESNIELISTIDDNTEFIGDRDRIIQVLNNLISNAIKFSLSGNQVAISVSKTEDCMVRFSVADKGPGISERDISKLFELFQQVDSSDSRSRGGTGLGLAISKAIVNRLGGRIGLESELGVGSTFWFELPAASLDPAQPNERLDSDSETIREFLAEYARRLPSWISELATWLGTVRHREDRTLLSYCQLRVRKLRTSAEPCGFPEVSDSLILLETELEDLARTGAGSEQQWNRIEGILTQIRLRAAGSCNNK